MLSGQHAEIRYIVGKRQRLFAHRLGSGAGIFARLLAGIRTQRKEDHGNPTARRNGIFLGVGFVESANFLRRDVGFGLARPQLGLKDLVDQDLVARAPDFRLLVDAGLARTLDQRALVKQLVEQRLPLLATEELARTIAAAKTHLFAE